jgi:hypothetical protein
MKIYAKISCRIAFLLIIMIALADSLRLDHKKHNKKHVFYALEDAPIISLSESIKLLNDCKEQCLTMKKIFPFSFKVKISYSKYHRFILRQTTGITKYVTG